MFRIVTYMNLPKLPVKARLFLGKNMSLLKKQAIPVPISLKLPTLDYP